MVESVWVQKVAIVNICELFGTNYKLTDGEHIFPQVFIFDAGRYDGRCLSFSTLFPFFNKAIRHVIIISVKFSSNYQQEIRDVLQKYQSNMHALNSFMLTYCVPFYCECVVTLFFQILNLSRY